MWNILRKNNVDYTKQSPVILSLCPGMRGLERGVERAFAGLNWKRPITAAYVEIEAFICWNLVKQMEQGVLDSAPVWTDVKTFDGKPFRDKIDGIFGGYPCQPFSVAGERKGTDDPRHLWPFIAGIIQSVRPVFCFFENVRGHLTMGFDEVLADLRNLGYAVEPGIFSAEEVGAPHKRERLFILAIRTDQLADTGCFRQRGGKYQYEVEQEKCTKELFTGTELADPTSGRHRKSEEEVCTGWNAAILNGIGLAHSIGARLEGTEKQPTWKKQPTVKRSGGTVWPARPGQQQYEWEAPRVESRLGFTTYGYSFREDLLRMAGNGVVEQSAELAFLTLLKKHESMNEPSARLAGEK